MRRIAAIVAVVLAGTLLPVRTLAQETRAARQQRLENRDRAVRERAGASACPSSPATPVTNSVASATDFVELERSGPGMATSAKYRVRVSGDGLVGWRGDDDVVTRGEALGEIDANMARQLIQRLADRGFWTLCGRYSSGVPGAGVVRTTLTLGGRTHIVEDRGDAGPAQLQALELEIDRVADTHVWRRGVPAVETFGEDGTRVDLRLPKAGVTQLMRAAGDPEHPSELDKVLLLLTDVNARDSAGWTALMYAAGSGSVAEMETLLRAGALPELRTDEGETALFAAVRPAPQNDPELQKALRDGRQTDAASDPTRRIELLHQHGVDMNATDRRGVTPLMVACRAATVRVSVVRLLLDLGADPAKRDVDGHTALDALPAAQMPEYQQIRALLTRTKLGGAPET